MIIKIFKISTAEMWALRNKKSLILFVEKETGTLVSEKLKIEQLVKYLPVEDYYWVKTTPPLPGSAVSPPVTITLTATQLNRKTASHWKCRNLPLLIW